MKLKTQRDLIRRAAEDFRRAHCLGDERWQPVYVRGVGETSEWADARPIYESVAALNPETATVEEMRRAAGVARLYFEFWYRCDECGRTVPDVIEVGERYECECAPPELCADCAGKAFRLISQARPARSDATNERS